MYAFDRCGDSRGASVGGLDSIDVEIIMSQNRTAHRFDEDSLVKEV